MSVPMYKKLADLSFTDLYIQTPDENMPEIRAAAGRMYAKIHRSRPLTPRSLRVDEEKQVATAIPAIADMFVIPKMR